jgi:pimeloyl-ACP methyl ester carboxylesterase
MNKFTLTLATLLSCTSLLLARHAAEDLPKRIESDGHWLRMRVEGEGSPTVVLEIGIAGPLEEWAAVQPAVAKFTRVVSYDRIGSNYRQESLTGKQIAADLHAALADAHVPPPYVLVGQSFGGVYNRVFASMYPDEVVGMVLLDPAQEQFIDWMKVHHPQEEFSIQPHRNWPEAVGVTATLDELKSSGPLPDVPVVVVSCTRNEHNPFRTEVLPMWTAAHDEWVQQLPQGRHVITDKSGHGIQVDQPDLVVDLIREVVEQARHSSSHAATNKMPEGGGP